MYFPISGVEISAWIPPLFAFVIAFTCSTAGVTGAFLLMPFQISVLGFVGPAASATNLLYNIFSSPGGMFKYWRNNQMLWQLVLVLTAGTVPGMIIGIFIRIHLMPDPTYFKLFVGMVLLLLGFQLLVRTWLTRDAHTKPAPLNFLKPEVVRFDLKRLDFSFDGEVHGFNVRTVAFVSFVVGIVGGAYGIGGGSLTASFLVGVCGLPIYTTAGATITATFFASIIGVIGYWLVSPIYAQSGMMTSPDWLLGLFFGAGGLAGMFLGAKVQRFIPAKFIRTLLGVLLLGISLKYIFGFYRYLLGWFSTINGG